MQCNAEVKKDTVDEVADAILSLGEGTRIQVFFPLHTTPLRPPQSEPKARGRKKKASEAPQQDLLKARLFELRQRGFGRLYQNSQVFEFSTPESLLDVDFTQPVFVLVDRISVSPDVRSRIVDAVETCYREAGEIIVETAPSEGEPASLRFAQRFECKRCHLRFDEPEPRLFSFNSPYGACPRCQGFGNTIDFDMDLVIPDKSRSLNEGRHRALDQAQVSPAVQRPQALRARRTTSRSTCPGRICLSTTSSS